MKDLKYYKSAFRIGVTAPSGSCIRMHGSSLSRAELPNLWLTKDSQSWFFGVYERAKRKSGRVATARGLGLSPVCTELCPPACLRVNFVFQHLGYLFCCNIFSVCIIYYCIVDYLLYETLSMGFMHLLLCLSIFYLESSILLSWLWMKLFSLALMGHSGQATCQFDLSSAVLLEFILPVKSS